MPDPYESFQATLTSPAIDAKVIAPNDSSDLPDGVCRSIWVGVSGNVELVTLKGTTVVFPNVPVGMLPVRASRVKAGNTTASSLLAIY